MLFLNNEDVQQVLTVGDTLRVLEEGFVDLGRQALVSRPRVDIYTETTRSGEFHRWGTMEGSSSRLRRLAIRMKSDVVSWPIRNGVHLEDKYCVRPGLFCGLIFLVDTDTGEPLAIINDGYLQHLRVGALAALGVKYLARSDAQVVGMLGAGGMARSHLLAFAAVRQIRRVQVYSPTKASREGYAREMQDVLGIDVVPCESPAEAARGAHILATCTNAMEHTIFPEMLEAGMHLTKVSSEWGPEVDARIDVSIGGDPSNQVVTGHPVDDSAGFTTYLAGDAEALAAARGKGHRRGTANSRSTTGPGFQGRAVPLGELITGRREGRRTADEISASTISDRTAARGGGKQGLQFVTVSSLVYDLAIERGLGRQVPVDWFLQDIRD
jgi:alanine dehydrogenase